MSALDARSILIALRDGKGLPEASAQWFARGLASGTVDDAQGGAFAMAVLLNGIGPEGRVALTRAMRDSGDVLDWDLPDPVVDKHSTGGIGDSVSLLLAPALAACGVYVPMISGRGLGHTGGTLDKLEAIPGYRGTPGLDTLRAVVREAGCAIVGATDRIAPADRRLYGIRDVSGTVESIDLITASILSKKLAAGLEALVLDVKCGSGAFMQTPHEAEALARALVETARGAGCPTTALITDMDEPLGHSAGNALEVIECLEILTGTRVNQALWTVTCALGAEALLLAKRCGSPAVGARMIANALSSGQAAERFGKMVAALGGPADFVERYPDRLPAAAVVREIPAPRAGHVARIDTRALGMAVVRLGGGRRVAGDRIDPGVGLSALVSCGTVVDADEALGLVHAATPEAAEAAITAVQDAYVIGDEAPLTRALIRERIAE
ncbi:thymidine phosphorylase [Phaeovulum vinaykumarii]|uniref:Thymidine phosphorylase n=1 Tax=Phaeovulum vinaykumarii TaxID=407234 RepID=A0A1N7L6U2_9RHOB|nr:thymidine phosphorylase [Phaeovulum vinaykumarii]SIS69503.1 thymidine phosphorylase [Phaeovulum vinaykumarii]SOB99458.1 thymidine phosphorylase [Phaeovulum vinaykumarii]